MKTRKFLYINTTNHKQIEVVVIEDNEHQISSAKFSCDYQFQIKDKLLKIVNKVLFKSKITRDDLDGIFVVNKSKEMTSLRIGVSMANALAYGLNIPILGIKQPVLPSELLKKIKRLKIQVVKPVYEINPMLKK